MYIVKKPDNVPSRLLPISQWPHGNSCTWAHDVHGNSINITVTPCHNRTSCAQVHELPWGHWQIGNNWEGTLCVFLTTYIYYAYLASVGFEHSVCHEPLLTSFLYKYIYK